LAQAAPGGGCEARDLTAKTARLRRYVAIEIQLDLLFEITH
jgi:hypothetical protein